VPDSAQWVRINELFHAVVVTPAAERAAFLSAECGADAALRAEVESLLAAHRDEQTGVRPGAVVVGSRLGDYEVTGFIAAGGMGEVYRAHDTKLGRDVAIKILPRLFVNEPERLARFEREARMLASLNHPNIAAIYGLEECNGAQALVLELVDGPTLADRLAKGPLTLRDALTIAVQIADALEAAHEKGIVHRDLKPANVKITAAGTVKVLDFGLAKAVAGDSGAGLTQSPTVTVDGTREGVILGTAAYMSPEQARGQAVDKRTDMWAFGCVVYEMLTGLGAFSRETITDTLAAIVEREPDWSPLPPETPAHVLRLLKRCLEKDPRKRLRDIGDARIELDEMAGGAPEMPGGAADRARSRRREHVAWSFAAVGLAALTASVVVSRGRGTPVASPVARTTLVLPADETVVSAASDYPLAVSPDGARFAYVAAVGGRAELYVRELDALEPRAIAGTAGARHPFFSPDGEWIGFFAGGALQRVAVNGGAPLRICNVSSLSMGGSWGPGDIIVFATNVAGLAKVNVAGGTPEPLNGSSPASWPQILPDGKTVLFTAGVGVGNAIVAMSLDGRDKRIVARTSESTAKGPAVIGTGGDILQARYVPSGHLLYGQDPGVVRAVTFDLDTLTVTGPPVSMIDGVERASLGGAVYFAVSNTGTLLYASRGDRHQLVWVERNGTEKPASPDRAAFRHPRLSPDGKRIAVAIYDETRRPLIWIYDAERGTKTPLNAEGLEPLWSPDGTRLSLVSEGGAILDLPVDGTAPPETILPGGPRKSPTSWSPDGQHLLFYQDGSEGNQLRLLDRASGSAPRVLSTRPSTFHGMFSPDGRWIAYVSTESGRAEVYVGRSSDLANTVAVSTQGGARPRWSRNGRELFFREREAMMVASVDASHGFSAGRPQRLFAGPYAATGRDVAFDVSADGQRFLMIKADPASTLQSLTIVQNWQEDLKRLAPTKP